MDKNDSNIMTQRIKSEARQLSAKYKLDQKRVVNVLNKIAEINWYDSNNAIYSSCATEISSFIPKIFIKEP